MASGATISAIRSLADRMNVPIVTFQSTGGGMRCEAALWSHILRHEQREDHQQLGDADRGDGEHEARRLGEASDERQLDDRAECDGRNEADTEAEQVGEPGEHDQPDRQRCRDESEVGLGEVDHPVGAVHQRHAHREQRGEEAEDDAAYPGARRHSEEDQLHCDEAERRQ